MNYNLCRSILGVQTAKIAEFEKADLQLKTISLNPNGVLKESKTGELKGKHKRVDLEGSMTRLWRDGHSSAGFL